jgi:uncharacterized protein YecE (DUF72 family)
MADDIRNMSFTKLHIGTSGWSYKHWSGIFYPEYCKADKYLEFYTTKFACVELNSSFYHLPLKSTVTGWMNRTPETFKFCTKLSRLITHQLQLVNAEGALQNFLDVFGGMNKRLGPVLIQLPPGLTYNQSLISNFFNIIKEKYSCFQFAVEVRNKSWINDNFFDLLGWYGITFVIADSGDRFPYSETVTSGSVYLRFHGREQLYASDYDETDLRSYAEKIINWLSEGKEVWVFFNNDYHGFAVKNAGRLIEIVSQQ